MICDLQLVIQNAVDLSAFSVTNYKSQSQMVSWAYFACGVAG